VFQHHKPVSDFCVINQLLCHSGGSSRKLLSEMECNECDIKTSHFVVDIFLIERGYLYHIIKDVCVTA
jgi:hypothetical protein